MLRKYCIETAQTWDEGVPFVVFAAREAVQESLKFSPAELVFRHTPRGPLRSLQEKFMKSFPLTNSLKFFRRFDRSAVYQRFQVGDTVFPLLPIPGSALAAKFAGPYEIVKCLSDTDYVISTPERQRKTQVCHINMLKVYHSRNCPDNQLKPVFPTESTGSSALIVSEPPDD